jgi:lipoate-protein ligase A
MLFSERVVLNMGKSAYKVQGGKMIKVQLSSKVGKIEKIKIMGDFFLHPEELIEEMEEMLIGSSLEESNLANSIRILLEKRKATLLGVSPEDFAKCIVMAGVEQ